MATKYDYLYVLQGDYGYEWKEIRALRIVRRREPNPAHPFWKGKL